MSEISFALATQDDDAGIRRLLATNAMPGRIRVRFEREPSYFAGCEAMAPFTQVLVARDRDRVVGVACRAVRKLYINGIPEDIGYLGHLRVDASHRGRLLVARGFRKLRELHEDGRARGYITTIVEGNTQAEGVLVRRARGAMPRYRLLDQLVTLAIPARGAPSGAPASSRPTRRLPAGELLRELAPARNLFPADEPKGHVVAVDGAVAALVDQRSYKQTVIDGYAPWLGAVRPLYNMVGRMKLPHAGQPLNHAYVTHFCARDAGAASSLIVELQTQAGTRGFDHILLGFSARDPLLPVARRFKPIEYFSHIYTVAWDAQDDLYDRLDSRPCAVDIAAL